jgi:hypothetical protein
MILRGGVAKRSPGIGIAGRQHGLVPLDAAALDLRGVFARHRRLTTG